MAWRRARSPWTWHPGAAQIAPGMLTAAEFFSLSGQLPKARFENGWM